MKWWRKKQMPIDERVEGLKQKLYKEAYFVAMSICLISLIYKTWVLDLGTDAAVIESVVLVVSGLYFLVRGIRLGIYSDEAEMHDRMSKWSVDQKTALMGLVVGFVLATAFGVRSAALYGDGTNWLRYFVLVFITSLLFYVPFLVIVSVVGNKLVRKASEKASNRDRD